MEQLVGKKKNLFVLLFCVTYMVSYITRINYGAIISEIERATQISKSMLSMALTGSFITYGVGQVIGGIIGERIRPKRLILFGLGLTACMNFAIPFCKNPWLMLVVWSLNGCAQSLMWPPIIKISAEAFSEEEYKQATTIIFCGASLGTMIVYLGSPLLIKLMGWRSVFFFSAACGVIMMAFVWRFCVDVKCNPQVDQTLQTEEARPKIFTPMLFVIMFVIVCKGMIRDGVQTWMPSLISETYRMDNLIAILSGAVLPVFAIVSNFATSALYRKKFKNPLTCTGVIFTLATVATGILFFTAGRNAVCSILCMAVLTACMHGASLMLTSMISQFYIDTGRVSTVSGVLNACTYIGSAISTYGVALLSEAYGWNITIFIWLMIAIVGTSLCYLISIPWRKKMMTTTDAATGNVAE